MEGGLAKSKKTEAVEVEIVEPATVMGRPTTFRPEYVEEAMKLCAMGATDNDLAEWFEVSERTINRWKITHPEFAQALTVGKDGPDSRMERSLYQRGMGYEYEETVAIKLKDVQYHDGKKVAETERVELVKIKKTQPPDTTAMIFWLKNRREKAWRDVHKHEVGQPGDFDMMDYDDLTAYIKAEAVQVLNADELTDVLKQLPSPTDRKDH